MSLEKAQALIDKYRRLECYFAGIGPVDFWMRAHRRYMTAIRRVRRLGYVFPVERDYY